MRRPTQRDLALVATYAFAAWCWVAYLIDAGPGLVAVSYIYGFLLVAYWLGES